MNTFHPIGQYTQVPGRLHGDLRCGPLPRERSASTPVQHGQSAVPDRQYSKGKKCKPALANTAFAHSVPVWRCHGVLHVVPGPPGVVYCHEALRAVLPRWLGSHVREHHLMLKVVFSRPVFKLRERHVDDGHRPPEVAPASMCARLRVSSAGTGHGRGRRLGGR